MVLKKQQNQRIRESIAQTLFPGFQSKLKYSK